MADAAIAELRDALATRTTLTNVTAGDDFVWGEAALGIEEFIVNVDPETDDEPATVDELVERVVAFLDTPESELDDITEGVAEDLAEYGLQASANDIYEDLYLRSVVIYVDVTLLRFRLPDVAPDLRVHVELNPDGEVEGVAISTAEDDDEIEYLEDDFEDDDFDEDEDEEDATAERKAPQPPAS